MTFDDVHKAARTPADAKVSHAIYHTFDGLELDIAGRKDGTHDLITITVHSTAKETADEAQKLTAQLQGWEYELPSYKYDCIFHSMDDLLKPVEPPKKADKGGGIRRRAGRRPTRRLGAESPELRDNAYRNTRSPRRASKSKNPRVSLTPATSNAHFALLVLPSVIVAFACPEPTRSSPLVDFFITSTEHLLFRAGSIDHPPNPFAVTIREKQPTPPTRRKSKSLCKQAISRMFVCTASEINGP